LFFLPGVDRSAREDYQNAIPNGEEMAKPNYQFQKRQRDLAKKKKKEEKRLQKLARKQQGSEENPDESAVTDTEDNDGDDADDETGDGVTDDVKPEADEEKQGTATG
jgi:hypothetical protein